MRDTPHFFSICTHELLQFFPSRFGRIFATKVLGMGRGRRVSWKKPRGTISSPTDGGLSAVEPQNREAKVKNTKVFGRQSFRVQNEIIRHLISAREGASSIVPPVVLLHEPPLD